MNIVTYDSVIRFIGTVTKGTYPEADPSRELYKITNDNGTYYAVTEGFVVETVDSCPEGVCPTQWCYSKDKGFYENPNWTAFSPYGRDYQQGYEQALLDLMEI